MTNITTNVVPARTLRERLIEDMDLRRLSHSTQRNYVRDVTRFATWLGRPPDTATGEEVRQFQIDQRDLGLTAPTMNSVISALRFFFTRTIDRPDLARKLYRVRHARALPTVLSREEVTRMLEATTSLKHQAICDRWLRGILRIHRSIPACNQSKRSEHHVPESKQ